MVHFELESTRDPDRGRKHRRRQSDDRDLLEDAEGELQVRGEESSGRVTVLFDEKLPKGAGHWSTEEK